MRFYLDKSDTGITSEKSLKVVLEELRNGKYLVEFKLMREKRSLNQNSFFHGVVVPCYGEYVGHIYPGMSGAAARKGFEFSKEDLKDIYLPVTKRKNPLDKRRIIKDQVGTSDLDTKEFADLINVIHHDMPWIPLPDTGEALTFYNEMLKRYPDINR